ncbi:TonB-dependent siderophore receptor [Salipiger sp. IMCC34102]|uniref:TonB-dependent siderophore receptor n=1 Tax=Salipiger sp. IMCC34102 TaxID=2510647 RepID=UPI00101DC13F|nr:TonB-dependent siderophore receptor [Salipiger sp. IMCC34102]RYH02526.1 TonB-dependent siderophore receptor [Salipiger sp. IMCC34102]
MTRTASLAAWLAGTTALATPLAAQETAPVGTGYNLGEIVFEVRGADPVGEEAAPFTLSGIKTATPITQVPQSVSVVGRETFEDTHPAKVDEVLRDVAGVQSQLYGYDSDTNWYYIRGFNSFDTGAFLDGLSLFSYGFGTFYIDPFLLERVEVLKGPASMLYGASSPGGIVNSVSRLPDGSEGRAVTAGTDSEGRTWLSGEASGLVGDDLSYRFGAKLTRQDGHGMFDDGFEGVLFGGATKAFADGSRLTFHLSHTEMDEDHVGGQFLPIFGTEYEAPFGYFDQYYNAGDPDTDDYDRSQTIATGIYRTTLGGWDITDTARLGRADISEAYLYANGFTSGQVPEPGAGVNRFVFGHESEAVIAQNDLRATRELVTGAVTHDLLFGLDLRRYRLDEAQAFAFGTALDPRNPDYSADQPALGDPYIDGVRTQEQVGVYAQDQLRFGQWIATLNARYDFVKSEFDNRIGDDLERDDEAFTGRVALAYDLGNVTPYVTAGTYFNPQALDTTTREAEPETGRQVEVGVKWQPNAYSLVTVSAFDIQREDVSQSFVNGGAFDARTLGEVRSRGIEMEADLDLSEEFGLRAALTAMDVEITDFEDDPSFEGNIPQSVIGTFGSLQMTYSPLSVPGLEIRAGARYLGDSFADNANDLEIGDATLFDAGVTYDFATDWTADLNVTNLADERYTASCQTSFGTSSCWQGEGRVATLAVTRSF